MNEYKVIPSFPKFELCDTADLEHAVRTVGTHEYLKVWLNCGGYPRVYLGKRKGGDGKFHSIHRLVAETYFGIIPNGMEIDHINCNRKLYVHTNLRIVSHKENMNNPLTIEYKSEASKKRFLNPENRKKQSEAQKIVYSKPENRKKQSESHEFQKRIVQQIDKDTGNIINEYFGVREAERQTGINHSNISQCCNGKLKTAGGFLWQFK